MIRRKKDREGTATLELAVALPILLLLIFGGMEAANGVFLKQGMTVAAYETAKMATTVGYTSSEALARGQAILDARGFGAANISIAPPDVTAIPSGSYVTVTVSGTADINAISPAVLLGGATVSTQIVMRRN